MAKKIVSYPITVPDGKFCWDRNPPYDICEHFDNEGGHSVCELKFFGSLKDLPDGVLKSKNCSELKVLGKIKNRKA